MKAAGVDALSKPRGQGDGLSHRWADLASPQMEGVKPEQRYRDTLAKPGGQGGMLGIISGKGVAGQYFTPRALIQAIVDWVRPAPGERQKRKATWSEKNPVGRWRPFGDDEIVARDKVSLAQEIAADLRSVLGQIEDILGDLVCRVVPPGK